MDCNNLIKSVSILIICCLISISSHSFPKKKHSIVKEKIDRNAYQNIQTAGYYHGFLQFCNFQKAVDKNFQKRIKGVVAYTNWDLFLVFNNGMNDVETALYVAGVGYTNVYDSFAEQPIMWKHNITGCDSQSLNKAYAAIDGVIPILVNFLLERDYYQENLDALLSALKKDKRDDYNSAIQIIKSVSSEYDNSGTYPGTTVSTENSDDEDFSSTNETMDQNNSDDVKSTRDQLKELKSLYDDGLISEDDYNAKKQEILDNL